MKKAVSLVLTLTVLISVLSVFPVFAAETVITNESQFLAIKNDPSGSYRLGNDISLSALMTDSICSEFSGTLDGDGYRVSGISISTDENTGLFDTVSGTVKNITFEGTVTAENTDTPFAVGGVCRTLSGGTFEKVTSKTDVIAKGQVMTAGGLCAVAKGSFKISECVNDADVTVEGCYSGDTFAGGIVAFCSSSKSITLCKNTGSISVDTSVSIAYAGGIAGVLSNYATVSKCQNEGSVYANGRKAFAGGIVSSLGGGESGASAVNCANFADVTADGENGVAGGIAADMSGHSLYNTFVSPEAVITAKTCGRTYGLIQSSQKLCTNYTEKQNSYSGFDFENIWQMVSEYPEIMFEKQQQTPTEPEITVTFKDVNESQWFYDEVVYAVRNGIFDGKSETEFAPNAKITRAEFVQVLANLAGLDVSDKNVKTVFSDVPAKKWYTPAVKWASENGIVSGFGNGMFLPNEPITREQMCVMIDGYMKYAKYTYKLKENKVLFTDHSTISSWAADEVYSCQRANLINGKGGGIFDPKANATRAEVATVFQEFHMDYIAK